MLRLVALRVTIDFIFLSTCTIIIKSMLTRTFLNVMRITSKPIRFFSSHEEPIPTKLPKAESIL